MTVTPTTSAPPDRLPRLLEDRTGPSRLSLDRHRACYRSPPPPQRRASSEIIRAVADAGLRGRGGASFPTAVKMETVAQGARRPRVVVNGSEGEPASRKDSLLMRRAPHLVLDGAIAAAAATAARFSVSDGMRSRASSKPLKRVK
jgi:Na+-translocating ferredoxin:NAD+ oxidoreductase RnfC subunit